MVSKKLETVCRPVRVRQVRPSPNEDNGKNGLFCDVNSGRYVPSRVVAGVCGSLRVTAARNGRARSASFERLPSPTVTVQSVAILSSQRSQASAPREYRWDDIRQNLILPGKRVWRHSNSLQCVLVRHNPARNGNVGQPMATPAIRIPLAAAAAVASVGNSFRAGNRWQLWRRLATHSARGNRGSAWQRIPNNRCPLPALPAREVLAEGHRAGVCVHLVRSAINQSIHSGWIGTCGNPALDVPRDRGKRTRIRVTRKADTIGCGYRVCCQPPWQLAIELACDFPITAQWPPPMAPTCGRHR
jgi:hypothetical protein